MPPADAPPEATKGGVALRATVDGMMFFDRRIAGGSIEISHRSAGVTSDAQGRFSIGLRLSGWPKVGEWSELPFDIVHLPKLNLIDQEGDEAGARIGNVPLFENDVYLTVVGGNPIQPAGYLSFSPGATEVITIDRYRLTNVRMSMVGIDIPIRLYFNKDAGDNLRFFGEAALGMDKLFVRSDIQVETTRLVFDQVNFTLTGTEEVSKPDIPFDGTLSQHVIFTRLDLGGGMSYGRFDLSVRWRSLFSMNLEHGKKEYKRVRGNVLAIPLLAGAAEDPGTMTEIEQEGAIHYANVSLPRKESQDGADSSERAAGVSRYWDGSHWLVSVGFRIF